MKKLILVILALGLISVAASAQTTANGTLAITGTVQSSVYLTVENAPGGPTLTNAGHPDASLALGNVSAYPESAVPAGFTKTVGASDFTLSANFGILVVKSNTSSANYTLKAALTTDPGDVHWSIDSVALSTVSADVTTTDSYGTQVDHPLALTIPLAFTGGSINNTINFTATAN